MNWIKSLYHKAMQNHNYNNNIQNKASNNKRKKQ